MLAINQLISSELIIALGWTLVNIIWQASIIAFVLWFFLKIFRNISSHIRYIVAISSIVMILGIAVLNFVKHYQPPQNEIDKAVSGENISVMLHNFNQRQQSEDFSESYLFNLNFLDHIDSYFPLIINVWSIGIAIFVIKFLLGLSYLKRIEKRHITRVDEKWVQRFRLIEQKLSLQKNIAYLESVIVKIPMVLGHLKPVVIVPFGMLTGIPEDQVEAIIAHEMAHVMRNDFLVNLLQTLVEILFFFHPAVWYISTAIRSERENCCDDIALTVCQGSLAYAKALVSVHEYIPAKSYSAVAFAGNKNQLINRIKRLIMEPKIESNSSDRIIATLIVLMGVIVASLSFSFKATSMVGDNKIVVTQTDNTTVENRPILKSTHVDIVTLKDTTKRKQKFDDIDIQNNTIVRTFIDKDGKRKKMKLTLENGAIAELYIDGKKIPESEFENYQPEVDRTIAEIESAKEEIKTAMKQIEEIDFEVIKRDVKEAMKDVKIDMEKVQIEVAKAMEEMQNVDFEKIREEIEKSLESIKEIDIDRELYSIQKSIEEINKIDLEEIKRQMEETRKQIKEIDIQRIMADIEKEKENIMIGIDMETIRKEMQKITEDILNFDVERITWDVDSSFERIDKEELMNDLEKELKKLEGLELEKK